jgi:UDP-glucose 4-epimerase
LAAEEVLAAELVGSPVDFASFRFANVYGPRQDSSGEGGVVALFCDSLVRGEVPTILGTGKQSRDFVFVGDVVNAILMALDADSRLHDGRGEGPAYNISTGIRTSIDDLARTLRPISGYFGEFTYAAPRSGDIEHSALDPAKAREVFAWDARVPLDVGLSQTYRWFSAQK